ncbi:peptidoglycan-binding protein [Pedobacter heparinus]|uniref:peptidoglycan-binding protein n=1 Tax=Pedobacter heparinus TaxID=984 RepID=UPI00292F55B5|nr:peptidoglycan-binding protein [Pedobacter heparinus]
MHSLRDFSYRRNDDKMFKEKFNKKEYERVISTARKEIGVRETGCENCGVAIARYLAYVGFKTPQPWCAAFVSWCHAKAGYPQPRTAWSPHLFPKERLVAAPAIHWDDKKMRGLVYGLYYPSLKRIGHCGLVESIRNDLIYGLEGNTNLAGSRAGDGVYRKVRHKRTISKYADWVK